MKKIFLTAAICLIALSASAKIKYQSIDNIKGTNIVLVDKNAPEKVEVSDAFLFNNGQEYAAKQIHCDINNGVAVYRLKFKRLTFFKNCKVVLTVNRKQVEIDIQKNLRDR